MEGSTRGTDVPASRLTVQHSLHLPSGFPTVLGVPKECEICQEALMGYTEGPQAHFLLLTRETLPILFIGSYLKKYYTCTKFNSLYHSALG